MVSITRDSTCKHGDGVDVVEGTVAFAFEAGPEICYEDLCSLVESDCGVFETMPVIKTGKVIDEEVDKSCCRAVGLLNASDESAIESLVIVNEL